jgi:DNA polymerase (family 10)
MIPPYSLELADRFAAKIRAELAPFCERLEIAGSIRRRRPFVNDIDFVALPKPGRAPALEERVMRNAKRIVSGGNQGIIVVLQNDLQIDLWIAQPERRDLLETVPSNFGSLFMCRTGSKEHNIWLIEHAKKLGLTWNPYHGVFCPQTRLCIASETEEEIFSALQLDFIPPEKRER